MEQGLRLLIQLIIEFAPVIANLVQKDNQAPVELSSKQENGQYIASCSSDKTIKIWQLNNLF